MARKIIHVVLGKANPNRMNGVNKVVHRLASTQAQMGLNVQVWGITKDPEHNYPKRNFHTALFQDQTIKFFISSDLKRAVKRENKNSVIFHLHGAYLPQFFALAKCLVRAEIDYVYTPHGAFNLVAMQRSATKKKIYNRFIESFIVKHAKAVHSIGASEQQGTLATFKHTKQVLIPNGQDAISIDHSIKQNDFPIFGFVGRLDMHTKGLDYLMRGFAQFCTQHGTAAELWLLGDGPDRAKLDALAQKLNIEKQVKFKGAVYGTEKMEMMQQFDFLCLTSRNEGLPGVVLEAAAVGVPAIVSQETNMGEFITKYKSGTVLPENSPENISNAMFHSLECIKNGSYEAISNQATAMIAEAFDWKHIAEKHLAVYES